MAGGATSAGLFFSALPQGQEFGIVSAVRRRQRLQPGIYRDVQAMLMPSVTETGSSGYTGQVNCRTRDQREWIVDYLMPPVLSMARS
jgi:hypothetical protein